MDEWGPVRVDSLVSRPPHTLVGAPVLGRLERLPFHELSWEAFESLQLRMMLDVLGLRDPRQYGTPGQKQEAIDLIAVAADGTGTALQSKNWAKKPFTDVSLRAAVEKFNSTTRPFDVDHFIVGVSPHVREKKVINELIKLQGELHPSTLELWDAQRLSDELRTHPLIVVQYFTEETARAFCGDFLVSHPEIPSADARIVSDAIIRSPEKITGAQSFLDQAAAATEPLATIGLIESAQQTLRGAGFGAYANLHEPARAIQLARVGREREAARQILDEMWSSLDTGRSRNAQAVFARLSHVAGELEDPTALSDFHEAGSAALDIYAQPLGSLPDPAALLLGERVDRARLLILAGETALAHNDMDWLDGAIATFEQLIADPDLAEEHSVRLRLLHAEATGKWESLLDAARRKKLDPTLTPLISARYARYAAIREEIGEALGHWEEAASLGSLAEQWDDAGTWVFSRRAYLSQWRPASGSELVTLEVALGEQPHPSPSPAPRASKALEDAYAAQRQGDLRTAAIAAQRALRDAVTIADWSGEKKARVAFASVMQDSDEPERAAMHYALAAATKEARALPASYPNRFIDIIPALDASNHWTVGTGYLIIAAQADVVPADRVDEIVTHVLADFASAEAGTLKDVPFYVWSRFNNAVKALARLGGRLSVTDADAALSFFERRPALDEGSRFQDDDEAEATARVAHTHPTLAARAIPHLVALMARAQGARTASIIAVLTENPELSRPALAAVKGAGRFWAAEMLALLDPADVTAEEAAAAVDRMTAPVSDAEGIVTIGANTVGDSLLLASQPQDVLVPVILEQLKRVSDPNTSGIDRGQYLGAATNLALSLDEKSKTAVFPDALRLATGVSPSSTDDLGEHSHHPLAATHINLRNGNTEGRAILLASLTATTDEERSEVRRLVYANLVGTDSDRFATLALGNLGESVADDVAFLSGAGWSMRCLAAQLWARYGGPAHVGDRLAGDADVRVRHEFAKALADHPATAAEESVRAQLNADPSYRVRHSLATTAP